MPTLDKAKVTSPIERHSKLDLSHCHLTTSNFMDMQPVMYRHMIPTEKLRVQASAYARLAPLSVPTYGRCRLNMRAFFVPFRTVMPRFNDFIVDTVSSKYNNMLIPNSGIITSTPIVRNSAIFQLFTTTFVSDVLGFTNFSVVVNPADPNNPLPSEFDFRIGSTFYKFNYAGRQAFKILRSLGYHFVPSDKTDFEFSALAILAYLRVYFDWYSVSAYMDTNSYQLFQSWFTYDNPNVPLELDSGALFTIFGFLMRCSYDGDYFTAAWDNPVAPNSQLFSQFTIPDISMYDVGSQSVLGLGSEVVNGAANGTPYMQISDDTTAVGTKYSHDALRALTDYMKRHQLAGARTIDRYLADWGINLPADKLQRSTYLGMSSIDIRIGDVMSHSDTSSDGNPSNLGDYAGRGELKGGKTFEYQASEFGLFVIVSTILPTQGYVQGFDRNNLHVTKDEFFNADFDNLGVQGIAKGELYVSKSDGFGVPSDYLGVFGFTPRYAEYKVGRDQLTGDISLPSVLDGSGSWHLMRMFDDNYFGGLISNVMHNLPFCLGTDSPQYSRIFNDTSIQLDKFYLYYDFNVVAYSPCKSLFDTYEFENNGKDMVLDANGVKMN